LHLELIFKLRNLFIICLNKPGGMLIDDDDDDDVFGLIFDCDDPWTCLKWQWGLGQATREKNGHEISRK